jgi:hypothetical protein
LINTTGDFVAIAGCGRFRLDTKGVQRFTLDGRTEVVVVRHFNSQLLTARLRLDAECPQSMVEEFKN